MRKWICLCVVLAIVAAAVGCAGPAEPLTGMEWLQKLDAEDVASIRFSVAANPLSYTDYEAAEFAEIVEFLKSCEAAKIEDDYPASGDGEPKYFYVTMLDGSVHTLVSYGTYVRIDDACYKDCGTWLDQWPEAGRVQVSTVERLLNALERERTVEEVYLSATGEDGTERIWMRVGENWYQYADVGGSCREDLRYDGQYYRNDYRYIGPNYVTEGGEWKVEDSAPAFELPWPMNERQDPADYEYVGVLDKCESRRVTLRYLPDGILLHLHVYVEGGWISSYEVEAPDGTMVQYSLSNPSSIGNLFVYFEYFAASGQESPWEESEDEEPTREELEAQAELCRLALEAFQAADSYSLMQTDRGYDPDGEETTLLVWNSGDNWLRQHSVEVRTYTYLQYEGRQYQKYNSTTMTQPWAEADLSGEADCRDSWLREYEWDGENTYCNHFSQDSEMEGYTRVRLFVQDDEAEYGYYDIRIVLDDQGRLREISSNGIKKDDGTAYNSSVVVSYHDGEAVASYIRDAYQEATAE